MCPRVFNNLADWLHHSIPTNSWWLDSGATIHVNVSMQDCLHCQKPRSEEKYVFIGNDTSARVEGTGTFRLLLNTGHFLI